MELMEETQDLVETLVDISDDESLVTVPIDDRRTSKGSFSSMSPMMSEDSGSPYIHAGLTLPPAIGNPSSPNRSEFFSPRVNELRLSVDNLGPSPRLSGRESSESPLRASPKVNTSGMRSSPSSPRKMLVSTPVSGNFDFQGMISPHHVRKLSSRSVSSPRLVLSAQSPKVSPKENVAKVSPRDLFGLRSSSSSTPTKIPPRLPLSQNTTFATSSVPSSRRTASGTVIPPPMSGIAGQTRVMKIDKPTKNMFPPTSSKRSEDESVILNRSSDAVLEKTVDSAETEVKPVELVGYPLKPSLESRRAAFERLQVELFNRNRATSRDWESDGTIGGDSSTNASVLAEAMRKKVARHMGRRMSDPGLEYTYPWPVSVEVSCKKDAEESKVCQSRLLLHVEVDSGKPQTLASNEEDKLPGSPARLADGAAPLLVDVQSSLVKPTAVRLPSPIRTTSAAEDSQNTSSFPTSTSSPEQLTASIPPTDLRLEIPELYMPAATPHRALSMSTESNRPLESPALRKFASLPNPPTKKTEVTSKAASLFSNLASFAKSPGARSLSSRRKNRSRSVHSPSPAPASSPTRTLARRLAGFSGTTPVAETKAMSAPLPPSPKNISGPKVLSPRRLQEQVGQASPFQFNRPSGSTGSSSFVTAGAMAAGLPPPGLSHHHHHQQNSSAALSRQLPSGSVGSTTSSGQPMNPFFIDTAVPPPSALGLVRTVSSDELHQRAPMLSAATRSSSLQHHPTSHGVEEVPLRKSVSTSFAAATNTLASSLFPPALKEKSPSSSPTTRTSKRRASFNIVGFEATLVALKQKFKRKNLAAARDSTSTPSSPIADDRRTMHSTSVNSTLTEDSDDDGFAARRTDRARFYLDERHNSIDSEDDSMSETDEFRQDGFSFAGDDRENEDEEDADAFFAGVPKEATVEEILRAVGKVQSRKRRQELFESLFFCAPDFGDLSGEQMTGKVADFAEDSGHIDVLEMWLIKFRAVDKLRFYDPYMSERVREVLDEFVDGKARRPSSSDNEHFASFRSVRKDDKKPSFDDSEHVESDVDEEKDANDLASLIYVEPREDGDVDDAVSASSSSSSSGYSDSDVGRIREEVDVVRIAQRLLRRLNRSQNDFVYSNNIPNEWEHDFDEERGTRGVGLRKRRKSESDITLALSHVRLSEQFGVNNARDEEIGVVDMNDKPLSRLRRAASLPFLLLWNESSTQQQQPVRTKREYSASSFGSFRSLSHFATSPRKMSFTSRMLRDAEDEEHCVLEMLAFVVAPPLSTMQSSGSISQSSTVTATTTGSPPPSIRMLGSSIHASANIDRTAFRSETPSLIPPSYHGSSLVRTYSVDTPTSPYVLGSTSETWSVLGGGGDAGSVDGFFDGPISPISDHAMRRRDDSVSVVKGGRGRHGRQHSASQHHYKQPSGSSLHTLLSGTTFGPRRSVVSSSFSSFIEAEMMCLPERGLRGDIKKYEPRIVAEQLTATMCRTAYFQIGPNALRTSEARKRDENVQKLVRYFEVLSNWPVTEILTDVKRTASERIDDFGWFVSLAKTCREMGNYHAVFALVGGLQSPLLIWVADIAHRKDKKQFHSLKRLVRTDGNYRIYHADLTKRNSRLPCIPYLGLLNRTLLALQNDSPVFIDENMRIVNFNRCRLIRKTIADYLKWQNPSPHSLPSNGIVLDPCVRKALAESMSRSILDYRELSTMSSLAKSGYVKSVRQRAFHKARKLGHQIVHNVENH